MRSFFLALALVLLVQGTALAHRVNVFAFVQGGEIVVESWYSKSKKVRHGNIEVQNAQSGETLLTGMTDEQGLWRFPIPEQARSSGAGLRILLQAGEGHQNEWTVQASEFLDTPRPAESLPAAQPGGAAAASSRTDEALLPALTRSDVEEVVAAVLDAKLAPIKRELLEQNQGGPGMREIFGGIGWIFGLVGVAAYFKSRPRV